jgi:2-polyprenyl-6-hydroxyphenyl methylase/3-demethylubiquinone-9 3-methyltransferase
VGLLAKIQNRVRGVTQKWGSPAAKRELWNKEFAEGRWNNIEDTSGDIVYRFIEKYATNGAVLDLGCGSGNTACELNSTAYEEYLGVDISDVALEKAKARCKALNLDGKTAFAAGDIASFVPTKKYDVILFRESIYYVPKSRINSMLDRYLQFLRPEGVVIIRLHDQKQGDEILSLIEPGRQAVEKHLPESGPIIFVLR